MSDTITLALSKADYEWLQQRAQAEGIATEAWITQTEEASTEDVNPYPGFDALPDYFQTTARQYAARRGGTPDEQARAIWAKVTPEPPPPITEADYEAARKRMQRHIGAVSLGYATGADNESIDADLMREYADNHEEAA